MRRAVVLIAAVLAAFALVRLAAQERGDAADRDAADRVAADRDSREAAGREAADREAADRDAGSREAADRGAVSREAADRGADLYVTWCAHCHDRVPEGTALEMLPGPASLTLKYGGAVSPYVKERPELANAATLRGFLRNGSGSMPPFRKTEVTDADIAAIAAYFARTSAAAAP